ncbi:UNVERIFIED_CONTAM: hypothetical protein Sindi_0046700 [Sesamum indicum]
MNLSIIKEITEWWKGALQELRIDARLTTGMEGEKLVPDWKISTHGSVLHTRAGQDSWELYDSCCLPRDQAAILKTPHTPLEEHYVHSLMQAAAFGRALSLKCTGFHRKQVLSDRKIHDLKKKVSEAIAREKDLENQQATLEARVAIEIKAANFLNEDFEKYSAQVNKLNGFMDGFDQNKLNSSLDANFEPYPEEEAQDTPEDEIVVQIEDIENMD